MDISVQGRHEPLVRPHLVQEYRPEVLNLINHVHHQVRHNIKVRWREAHLELANHLCDELFHALQLSFTDDLLCDLVEEVIEACDDHLHILWTNYLDHNWEEHCEHDMVVMCVEAGLCEVLH